MEMNAVTSMKTWKSRCIQSFLSKQNLPRSPITITVYILPTHIKQAAHEWMLSDSRWTHLIDAARKWIEFSFSHLFSLVLLALLLFYYYMLLYAHATFFTLFFFLTGGWRMGSIPMPCAVATRRNGGSRCIWLLEMFRSSNSCWSLGSNTCWQIYVQVNDSLEQYSSHQLNTLNR